MTQVIVDTSFLMDIRAIESSRNAKDWLIAGEVIYELTEHINGQDEIKRQRAQRAYDLVAEMFDVLVIGSKHSDNVDEYLIELTKQSGGRLLTLDQEMRVSAQDRDVELEDLSSINNLRLPINEGDQIEVQISRKGDKKHQGIADHTLGQVFVDGSAEVGKTLSVRMYKIVLEGSFLGLFAEPIKR